VLQVSLQLNDGDGSGISHVEWSWDNASWQDYPAGGAIIWSNWSEIDLYVRATDNVGLQSISNLTIDAPANPNAPPEDSTSTEVKSTGGASAGGVATIVLIAMLLAGLAAMGIYLIFRVNEAGEDDDIETESEDGTPQPSVVVENGAQQPSVVAENGTQQPTVEPGVEPIVQPEIGTQPPSIIPSVEPEISTPEASVEIPVNESLDSSIKALTNDLPPQENGVLEPSEVNPETAQLPLTIVPNHEQLPSGGTYDTSTGVTWYILPDGSRWWMQEDGSFSLDQATEPPHETIEPPHETEEKDVISEPTE
jgi:hypothetical protein